MNHNLITILMHLKSFTFNNIKICDVIRPGAKCVGIGCYYCILSLCSPTSDRYVSKLLFRVPI